MKINIKLPSIETVVATLVIVLVISLIMGAWDMDRQVLTSAKYNNDYTLKVEVQETPALFRRLFDSEKKVVYYRKSVVEPVRRSMFIQFPTYRKPSGDTKYRWFDDRGHEVTYAPFAWHLEDEHGAYRLLKK